MPERTYFFPVSLLAAIPAAYAWQLYGWKAGMGFWVCTAILLTTLAIAAAFAEWSVRTMTVARSILLIAIIICLGVSAMETCDASGCTRFWK